MLSVKSGHGSKLIGDDGRTYLDLFANAGIASLGHGNCAFADCLAKQIREVVSSPFANEGRVEFWEQLSAHLPGEISRAFFFSTGAEANEAAIRFARSHTGRAATVAFRSGFHGRTRGAAALTGPSSNEDQSYLLDYPVRSEGRSDAEVLEACAQSVERCFETARRQIGALFVEPIQGTAGNLIPPDGFLRMLRDICSRHAALLIVDEVLTGIGRTGSWFRFLREDIVPDVLVLGKGIGNGVPISMLLTNDTIADRPIQLSSSFGGNLLSIAAANFVLREISRQNLAEHVSDVGSLFLSQLRAKILQSPLVHSIDGVGLMIGLGLCSPNDPSTPLEEAGVDLLQGRLFEEGIIVGKAGSRLRINPPLIFTDDEVDVAVAGFSRAFADASETYRKRQT